MTEGEGGLSDIMINIMIEGVDFRQISMTSFLTKILRIQYFLVK